MAATEEGNEKLWDALYRVMSETGLDPKTIALKAIVPFEDELEPFIADSTAEISDDTATRLAVFASKALNNPLGMGLAMVREATGMSLADVERATAISRYSVSKYERGERVPQIDALLILWREYREQLGAASAPDMEALASGDLGTLREWLEEVAP